MPHSRLIETANRLRTVAEGLNDPRDRAIAAKYAEELAHLADREIPQPPAIPLARLEDQAALEGVSGILKKVYVPAISPDCCADLILSLDEPDLEG